MKSFKKLLAVLMVTLLCVLSLTACGSNTRKCDECGKEAECTKVEIAGQEGWICDDCYEANKEIIELGEALSGLADLGNLF